MKACTFLFIIITMMLFLPIELDAQRPSVRKATKVLTEVNEHTSINEDEFTSVNSTNWEMFHKSIGVRLTKGVGLSYITTRGKKGKKFMEFIGLYFPVSFTKEFQWTFLYGGISKIKPVEGLYISYGGGVHFNNEIKFEYMEVGVDGLIRIGYTFKKIPLNLAFDFKPALEIYDTDLGIQPHVALNSGYGLSVRYVMKRRGN